MVDTQGNHVLGNMSVVSVIVGFGVALQLWGKKYSLRLAVAPICAGFVL